jgi:fluoride ion exporter CrcB/FEX
MRPNYVAVFVAAIAYWLLGALWFAVLFSRPWMALENITPEQAGGMNPIAPYIISFILNLVIAFVLAQLCAWRNADTAARGAALGILIWIGFVGPITYSTYMYEMRPKQLFAINEFYPLVGLCLMGAILGAWTRKPAA